MRKELFVDKAFDYVEQFVYIVIAILLSVTALLLIYNSIIAIWEATHNQDFIKGALHIIDRVLLTLMVLEILYTVRISYQSHSLSAEPFFIVGLIATIRRILIISVESAYLLEKFTYHMIELGVLGFIVLIFVFSIVYFRMKGMDVVARRVSQNTNS
ncbi:MAG: hypothetical protein Kow00108_03070 [Calditrichia bacterium]